MPDLTFGQRLALSAAEAGELVSTETRGRVRWFDTRTNNFVPLSTVSALVRQNHLRVERLSPVASRAVPTASEAANAGTEAGQ